jgi:hypothetical protein
MEKGGTRWETKARRIRTKLGKTGTNGKNESGETTDKNPCIETMGIGGVP